MDTVQFRNTPAGSRPDAPEPASRDAVITEFLQRNGYTGSEVEPLAQDASFRRYLRLRGTRPAVLMDAPPPEDVFPFLRIAGYLRGLGLSVPAILDADTSAGLVLEEDFGDDLLSVLLDRGEPAAPLLEAAVDALVVLQRGPPPANLPAWGRPQMIQAATGTLFDWWWPARYGAAAPRQVRDDIAGALEQMLAIVEAGPATMVHRDYFAGNLLWLPGRTGARQIGIIDFQTAAIGHPAYDLVSLLQDGRRDIPPETAEQALRRYLAARPDLDPAAFRAAYHACAAHRHLRVACQWVRLALRDKRPQYLQYGPRTWRLLDNALAQPAAEPLARALDRWIPHADRGNPPGRPA